MLEINNSKRTCFESIPVDPFWNTGEEKELKIHKIHSYPAKFPAFITTKALQYAQDNGLSPKRIADVFCGCGTVALEAKRNGISFWGCDINPVATMIAKAKSYQYSNKKLNKYYSDILSCYESYSYQHELYKEADERLKYWYKKKQYIDLFNLKSAVDEVVPSKSYYSYFFTCAFSNILKPTSKWLTKSIKPQIDPQKKPLDVMSAFDEQFNFMLSANDECDVDSYAGVKILTQNILNNRVKHPCVDMIVTSPPYVTSYEYADLHQLSSLWLEYADDYRDLRNGSIGSLHHDYNFEKEVKRLNRAGMDVVFGLLDRDKSKARSIAKYYLDMQQVTNQCYEMLSDNGMALFVIGNTEYKGIRVDNAKHLAEALYCSGFKNVSATKRKIKNKILTPYRDKIGRFTTNKSGRKVYSEEFIIVGKK
ncbi:MAG: hypothetical protein ACH255_18885 [Candidatus Thiodiazotropha sp.]